MNKLGVGISVVGFIGLGSASVMAAGITNPVIGGTNPTDFNLFCSNGTQTSLCAGPLSTVLVGNSSVPGGNVELAASSEKVGFDFNKFTSLSGDLNGTGISLSSLTEADWNGDLDGNGKTLTEDWLAQALAANGVILPPVPGLFNGIVQGFINAKGRERFSDPNIAYVNENAGQIQFGLAGFLNASNELKAAFGSTVVNGIPLASLVPNNVRASELVKVQYRDKYGIFFDFNATDSGQVSDDGTRSHTGNYEFSFGESTGITISSAKGGVGTLTIPTTTVEPTTLFGLFVTTSILFNKRNKRKTVSI